MNCMRPRVRALICAAMFAAGTAVSAQEPKSDFVFAFHGIVGGSLYAQDSVLGPGNGGQSWFVAQQFSNHKALFGGDVRQSRFSLAFAGPKIFQGATPRAYVEIDFSNNAGQGGYGDVSLLPRLRHVFAELNWGNTAIRFGQDHELLIGSSPWAPPAGPASVGHIGYPLVYQAGAVGWREPGVAVYQQFPGFFGVASLEFAAMVMRSQWVAPLTATGLPNQSITSFGEQSGYPGFEARVQAVGKNFRLGVSGHWNQSHRAGIGNQETAALPDLMGFNFTPELSVWGLAGTSKPSNSDVIAAGGTRLQNTVVSGMLRYQEGGYAIGLEYAHWHTRTTGGVPPAYVGPPDGNLDGNQLMLSGFYFF